MFDIEIFYEQLIIIYLLFLSSSKFLLHFSAKFCQKDRCMYLLDTKLERFKFDQEETNSNQDT